MKETPEVAVVIPVLNEAKYIAACLESLIPQASAMNAVIMVMDGGSADGTVEIVRKIAANHPEIAILHNEKRLQSAALNLAATVAPPGIQILVRADAHALYPRDYLDLCVTALRTHAVTSVVVPMRTIGTRGMQRAIACVQNSRLGNGGSAHRSEGISGLVDHGHHAAFDRAFFLRIGGYDETFSHNEDAEHDIRAHLAGGKIWMCREAAIDYLPRSALVPLAMQYFRHGRGRMRTLLRHGLIPRPRQMAAPIVLLGCLLGGGLGPWDIRFTLIPAAYCLLCLIWATTRALKDKDFRLLQMAPAAITIHIAWAIGFFWQLSSAAMCGMYGVCSRKDSITIEAAG